jgi:hypothetical protein
MRYIEYLYSASEASKLIYSIGRKSKLDSTFSIR